jgi:lysophospholipase L1-like esterase
MTNLGTFATPESVADLLTKMRAEATDPMLLATAPPPLYDTPQISFTTDVPAGTLVRELRASTNGPVDMVNDTHFLYDGAPSFPAQTNNPSLFVKPGLIPGGEAQYAYYQSRISFITSARTVAYKVRISGATAVFRVLVNRRWVTRELTRLTGLTPGAWAYVVLTFPSSRPREITFEDGGDFAFGGVIVPTGATVTRPAGFDFKLAIQGDSYAGGAGAPPTGAARLETWASLFARTLEDYLGARVSFINFAVGGTGYTTGTSPFSGREAAILEYAPDALIIFGSQNDGTSTQIQDKAAAHLAAFKTVKEVFTANPSPVTPAENVAQTKAATLAANRVFLDGWGTWITSADLGPEGSNPVRYVHPTFLGHQKIARGMMATMAANRPVAQAGYVPPPAVLLTDSFARTVSGTGGTYGVTDDGKTWTRFGVGDVVIDSAGAGYSAVSGGTGMQIVTAASDGTFEAVRSTSTTKKGRLIFRQTGDLYLLLLGNGTTYDFIRRCADTAQRVTINIPNVAPAAGDRIKVVLAGSTVTITINDVQVFTNTDANNVIGTGVGIGTFTDGLETRWRSVKFTAAA